MSEINNNIRGLLNTDLQEILKNFLYKINKETLFKFYTGKVIDNKDPEKLGRCKVRVYGIYEDTIPNSDVPWAIPDFQFIGSKIGSFIVPPLNAIVKVYFENNDFYLPIYTTKVIDKNNSLNKDSNLGFNGDPDVMIFFATDQGEYFKINRKTNETEYRTASGDVITIDNSGNVKLDTTGSSLLGGKLDVITNGNITVKIDSIDPTKTVEVIAPVVSIPHNVLGTVSPNPTGGPFCGLPNCIYSGAFHQGHQVTNL